MGHFPINHPLLPLWRVLAALAGLYVLAFGIVGVIQTGGLPFFAQQNLPAVLGLHTNRAFAILSIVAGVVLFGGAIIGGMLDQRLNVVLAFVFLGAGFAMMVLLRTDLNLLGFSMSTCIVSFIIGLVLLTAGLYGKVGSEADVRSEEAFRHGASPNSDNDPELAAAERPHRETVS
jgi:hypothetical protein